MQSYSDKFQKEITGPLRLIVIIILTLSLLLATWLEIDRFMVENSLLESVSYNNVNSWFSDQIHILDSIASGISYDTDVLNNYDATRKYLEKSAAGKDTLLAAYIGSPSFPSKMICSDGWIPEDDYVVEDRDWYQGAMAANGVFISEPYVDATYNILCISIAKPIDGTDAVISIDIDLTTLQQTIDSFCTGLQSVMLISTDGVIVTSPYEEYTLSDKSSTEFAATPFGRASETGSRLIRTSGISFSLSSVQKLSNIPYSLYCGTSTGNICIELLILLAAYVVIIILTIIIMKKKIASIVTKGFVPFENIKKKILRLAECNLDITFDDETNISDIRELQDSLNNMAVTLRSYIHDIDTILSEISANNLGIKSNIEYHGDFVAIQDSINNIIDKVRSILSEINSVSTSLNHSSEQIVVTADEMAKNNLEQSDSINELRESFIRFSNEMERINETIIAAGNAITENSEALNQIGETEMKNLSEGMQNINDSGSRISGFTEMIGDISSQTQLLSLNASIEAARAGESGRGFAVVAEEISKLSEDTMKVNLEIEQTIKTNNTYINEGIATVEKTRQTLLQSLEDNTRMAAQMKEISSTLISLSEKLSDIDSALNNSAKCSDGNAALTKEYHTYTDKLMSCSDTLKSNVEKYRLN